MIFLDVDGVLADFNSAACELHKRPLFQPTSWEYYLEWGLDEDQFWEPILLEGFYFYAHRVKPYPWAYDLYHAACEADEVMICSANPSHPGLLAGKAEWINRHFGDVRRIYTNEKHWLAGPERCLVDDKDENVAEFRAASGTALLFAQEWNADRYHVDKRMTDIFFQLHCWRQFKGQEYEQPVCS